jgi:hypothetical protein
VEAAMEEAVMKRAACSPAGMHGQNEASESPGRCAHNSPPPVLAGNGSLLRCSSAFPIQ